MSDDTDDEMTQAEEEAWCRERRAQIAQYLRGEELTHGEIGAWPAWYLAPYVAVWAIESLTAPGRVGWWAICGDLPSDYCASSETCDTPRLAVRHIATGWRQALANTPEDAETIGGTGLPMNLTEVFAARADLLLEWADNDEVWAEDDPSA